MRSMLWGWGLFKPGEEMGGPARGSVVCSAGAHWIRDAGRGPDTRGRRRRQKTVELDLEDEGNGTQSNTDEADKAGDKRWKTVDGERRICTEHAGSWVDRLL